MTVESKLAAMQDNKALTRTKLSEVDGAKNDITTMATISNEEKIFVTGMTINKVFSFMLNSSKDVEAQERLIGDAFRAYVMLSGGIGGMEGRS